jgi:ribonuclease VapC
MIIDTSALIAILRDEPEAIACARAIEAATSRRVSAATFVEAAIVIDGSRDPVASRRFDDLVRGRSDCRTGNGSSSAHCA